jgi:hypothetical protein
VARVLFQVIGQKGEALLIKAGALRKLPKRLMRDTVGIAIWDSALTIGNLSFRGVIAVAAEASVSKEPGCAVADAATLIALQQHPGT